MGSKYSSQSISGYNSSPPADDGTIADSNKVQWQKHLDKIGGPLKTLAEGINTALVTVLDQSSTSTTTTDTVDATHHNRIKEIASTVSTAITITLSDAATMAAGYVVSIHNLSAVQHTLGRATGADTINGTASNVPIAPYAQIKAWINASANGYLVSQGPGINSTGEPHSDALFQIVDNSDPTKKIAFQASGITTGTTRTVTMPDSDVTLGVATSLSGQGLAITLGTEQASTSGTAIDFTGIPSGVKRITVMLFGVSTNSTSNYLIQIGDSGGIETSGYVSSAQTDTAARVTSTAGFIITSSIGATNPHSGMV